MAHNNPHYPTAFGVHVADALNQSSMIKTANISDDEIEYAMKARHERGHFINWLSHRGPAGGFGVVEYLNDLPGN